MGFQQDFEAYIGGRASLIQIVSHEWEVVEGSITRAIKRLEDGREYLKWSESVGMQVFEDGAPKEPSEDQRGEFARLTDPVSVVRWYVGDPSNEGEGALGYGKPSILHIEDAHSFLDENHGDYISLVSWLRMAARMHLSGAQVPRTIVLGTTQPAYVQELDKEMPVLDLPLPNAENLGRVMDDCIGEANRLGTDIPEPSEEDSSDLIDAAKGLTVMEANLAYMKAIHVYEKLTADQIPYILSEKKQIIKRTGILEFIEPDNQEVGGLGALTKWLGTRKEGFSREAEDFGLEFPRGLLLLGFPGCGKSLTAQHTARTWNYPLLRFDIGRAFGGLVGESERNMRQALKVAEAVSPCILWIDEIEKGLSGSESSGRTDGGTSARVLGTFLTWMQEKTAPVFVLATSNNIDRMPPELTRKGRFDEIFFVDLPNGDSREEILGIHLSDKPEGSMESLDSFDLGALAEISSGYTGAELRQAILEGMHLAFSEDRILTHGDVADALSQTYPMFMTMREAIENMRLRKGKMYKPADEGESERLPAKKKADTIPLTPSERRRSNPFAED